MLMAMRENEMLAVVSGCYRLTEGDRQIETHEVPRGEYSQASHKAAVRGG